MSREKEFVKNSAILSIGTIFPKITSIITLPVITGCLSKADYGIYDLITVSAQTDMTAVSDTRFILVFDDFKIRRDYL